MGLVILFSVDLMQKQFYVFAFPWLLVKIILILSVTFDFLPTFELESYICKGSLLGALPSVVFVIKIYHLSVSYIYFGMFSWIVLYSCMFRFPNRLCSNVSGSQRNLVRL